jgi:hypothetical protein
MYVGTYCIYTYACIYTYVCMYVCMYKYNIYTHTHALYILPGVHSTSVAKQFDHLNLALGGVVFSRHKRAGKCNHPACVYMCMYVSFMPVYAHIHESTFSP